jgi:hypothetical protein
MVRELSAGFKKASVQNQTEIAVLQVLKAYQARINWFQNDSRFKFCQVHIIVPHFCVSDEGTS